MFWVLEFGVWDFAFVFLGLGFGVWCLAIGILVFRISSFGFWAFDFDFKVLGFGILVFGNSGLGFLFWIWSLEFGI